MALQLPRFDKPYVPSVEEMTVKSPWASLFEGVTQGIGAFGKERELQSKLKESEIANEYKKMLMQQQKELFPLEKEAKGLDLLIKQQEYKYPGLGKGGIPGAIAWSLFASDNPQLAEKLNKQMGGQLSNGSQSWEQQQPSIAQSLKVLQTSPDMKPVPGRSGLVQQSNGTLNPIGLLMQDATSQMRYRDAMINQMENNLKSRGYKNMPRLEQAYALSQARAFGFTGEQASELMQQGKTQEDLAKMAKEKFDNMKNINPDDKNTWPLPKPTPTIALMTQQGRANIAQAGMNAIEPVITDWLGPYSTRILGKSPKEIYEFVKGLNKDERAKAIAAAGYMYEMQILKLRSGGVQNIGIEAIRESLNTSLGNFSFLQATDPETWTKAQHYSRQLGQTLNKAENQAMWRTVDEIYSQEDKYDQQKSMRDPSQMSNEEIQAELDAMNKGS